MGMHAILRADLKEGIMKKIISKYLGQQDGATAIEYALIASGIALSVVTVVFLMGDELLALYADVLSALTG